MSVRILSSLLVVMFFITGCTGALAPVPTPTALPPTVTLTPVPTQPPTDTPTPVPPTATNTPLPTATTTPVPATSTPTMACTADDVLKHLKSIVTYTEFSISHIIFDGRPELDVWFVDPDIAPEATGESIKKNTHLALRHAVVLSHQLTMADPCVKTLFAGISPVVVDRNYNGWLSGMIAPASLPESQNPTEKELAQAENYFISTYQRDQPTTPAEPAPVGSCTWTEARKGIQRHFDPARQNVSFYPVIDQSGLHVTAQWDRFADLPDLQAFGLAIASLMNVALELPCLHPSADTIFAIVVDKAGNTELMGQLPREGIRKLDMKQFQVVYQHTGSAGTVSPVAKGTLVNRGGFDCATAGAISFLTEKPQFVRCDDIGNFLRAWSGSKGLRYQDPEWFAAGLNAFLAERKLPYEAKHVEVTEDNWLKAPEKSKSIYIVSVQLKGLLHALTVFRPDRGDMLFYDSLQGADLTEQAVLDRYGVSFQEAWRDTYLISQVK